MAEYHYANKLALHDEYLRIAPEEALAARELDPDFNWDEPVPAFGLSQELIADANATLPELLQEAEAALAKGNIAHIPFQMEQVLEAFQINLDHKSAAYRDLGLALLRAEVRAIRAIQQRHRGEPVETPPLPTVATAAVITGDSLQTAFEGWKRQRERPNRTLTEYERAIRLFVELHGDLAIVQIKKSHARHFREALQDVPRKRTGKLLEASLPEMAEYGREHPEVQKISAATVNKLLGGVQTVVVWAGDNGMVPDDVQWSDPFARMRLGEDEPDRAPFDLGELQAIFSTPVFTQGERPAGGKGEAAFWLPLLALFTGARRGELAARK
jgi:hypothetical protein